MARGCKAGLLATGLALLAASANAQAPAAPGFDLTNMAQGMVGPDNVLTSLFIVFLITILSLAPAILVMTTSFTRIIVVLGFLRQALATQQTPPNQVLIGLALFLIKPSACFTSRRVRPYSRAGALSTRLPSRLQPSCMP